MNQTVSCATKPAITEDKTVKSPLKKLIRRVKQEFLPTHARVRFDTEHGKWAVLGDGNKPLRHFEQGFLTNVQFSSETVHVGTGCGATSTTIGIAEGELVENAHSRDIIGLHNMRFHQGSFVGDAGHPLSCCNLIQLLPDRKAMYK